jgi:16S rRNA (cytosine967-C5)-methyltransferase
MAVSHLVDPQPGEHVLDLCAAPGGKTTHLAELMRDTGRIVAADVNARRLGQLLHTRTRLALSSIDVVGLDARVPALRPLAGFDRVLVDAPCSGLGTLRRHVDVRWRRTPAELERLPCLQLDLLRSGARQVRPGGVLVYATCTLEPTENEEVIAAFLAEEGTHFEVENAAEFLPLSLQAAVTPAGFVQTWPHRQQMDGFFMARLRRR